MFGKVSLLKRRIKILGIKQKYQALPYFGICCTELGGSKLQVFAYDYAISTLSVQSASKVFLCEPTVHTRGGGVSKYFSWYGDAPFLGVLLSNRFGIMGIFFTIFRHLTKLWVSFSGDFS